MHIKVYTIIIEQPIEQPKKRGRTRNDRPPKETKPRGEQRVIKKWKDPKKRGTPKNERPPKELQKKRRKPKPKTEQVERRPRGRPRIYNEGNNGRPKDIDYFYTVLN